MFSPRKLTQMKKDISKPGLKGIIKRKRTSSQSKGSSKGEICWCFLNMKWIIVDDSQTEMLQLLLIILSSKSSQAHCTFDHCSGAYQSTKHRGRQLNILLCLEVDKWNEKNVSLDVMYSKVVTTLKMHQGFSNPQTLIKIVQKASPLPKYQS